MAAVTLSYNEKEEYIVRVNYAIPLSILKKEKGFDTVAASITDEHFPAPCGGEVLYKIKLIQCAEAASTGEVMSALVQSRLAPANVHILFALGLNRPDIGMDAPIAALGSLWKRPDGCYNIPFMGSGGNGRGVFLRWARCIWRPYWQFAALRA